MRYRGTELMMSYTTCEKTNPACDALFSFFLTDAFHGGPVHLVWDKPHADGSPAPHRPPEKPDQAREVFSKAYAEDKARALKLLFFARDIRYGLGQRAVFRVLLSWLVENDKPTLIDRLSDIPIHGRWDDLLVLLDTPAQDEAVSFLHGQLLADQKALSEGRDVSLLAKWLPSVNASSAETKRKGKLLAKAFGMKEKEYRKALSALRDRIGIVENSLRKKGTAGIDYAVLPSRARFRYRGVFARKDRDRFGRFLTERRAQAMDLWRLARGKRSALAEVIKTLPPPPSPYAAVPLYTDNNGGDSSKEVMYTLVCYLASNNPELYRNCFITRSANRSRGGLKWEELDPTGKTFSARLSDTAISYAAILELLTHPPQGSLPGAGETPARIVHIGNSEINMHGSITLRRTLRHFQAKGYTAPRMVVWTWRRYKRGFDRNGRPKVFDLLIDNIENQLVTISVKEDGIRITGYNPLLLKLVMYGLTTPDEIAACGYF